MAWAIVDGRQQIMAGTGQVLTNIIMTMNASSEAKPIHGIRLSTSDLMGPGRWRFSDDSGKG